MKLRTTSRILYILFLFSGISGLVYETVWLRVLSRIMGSTVQASSITISAFMLGLTLGSFYIGKYVHRIENKIRFYALLEAGIAISAFTVFILFERLVPLYRYFFDLSDGNMLLYRFLQSSVLFILILVPTFLMGGTLPLLSTIMQQLGNKFVKTLSFLYGVNTLGAMLGVLLSGFVLLGSIGELNSVVTGIVINLLAGILIFSLGRSLNSAAVNHDISTETEDISHQYSDKVKRKVVLAYGIIGFTSFALEIIWIRMFLLPLGTAIYSFSTVLSIYLLGSAIGSYSYGKFFSRYKNPLRMLSMLMIFVGLYSLIGLFIYSGYLPWMKDRDLVVSLGKLTRTFLIIFPVTFMVGLMFPLISRIYARSTSETGHVVGDLYSTNTLGCILGSLTCGFIFIPLFGTMNTLIMLALINTFIAWWIIHGETKQAKLPGRIALATATVAIAVASFFLPDPYYSVIKKMLDWIPENELQVRMHKESATCTITAFGTTTDKMDKHLLINGIGMTSLVSETKLMAHLPLLLHHAEPKDMLIICYGMGTCLRSAVKHPQLHTDVVELVGEEYEISGFFHSDGEEVLANPRVRYFTDDGRNFLLMREKKYDVITIDPAPPIWSAGTVNLYTTEFFMLCKERLQKDGITCLWIPPSPTSEVKMIMKSFVNVYPNTVLYRGPGFPGFYMIGYAGNSEIDMRRFEAAANNKEIMADLNEWGKLFDTPAGMLDLKIKSPEQLSDYLKNSPEVSDDHPFTEFPLWRKMSDPEYGITLNSNEMK